MNKDEILKMAQKDEDEMEQVVLTNALGISTMVVPALCLLFMIIRIINSEYIVSDLIAIIMAQLSASQLYHSIKMKNRKLLVLGLFTLILSIISIVVFINEVKIWKKI